MERAAVRRGAWTFEEDKKLTAYIKRYGIWNWNQMPKFAGLSRSGKSCRLRWMNYLRPDLKLGKFTEEEDETIIKMHEKLGNRWSAIARQLPGRTDNEIKNHWHTRLKKNILNQLTKAKTGEVSTTREETIQKNTQGSNDRVIVNDDYVGNTEVMYEDSDLVFWTQPFLIESSSMEDQQFGYGHFEFDDFDSLHTSSFVNDFCYDFSVNFSETEDVSCI